MQGDLPPCVDVICKSKVSEKDVRSACTICTSDRNTPSRCVIGLSQHPCAISSLIVADWPLHYILQIYIIYNGKLNYCTGT